MTYQTLRIESPEAFITVARLNRPDAANALNTQMALELKDFFLNLPSDCRAVILAGEGKHFCAGADLKERKGMDEAAWRAQHAVFREARDALLACPVPVIAAVRGAAYAGGLELALCCDFIYAANDAKFALTEVTLGIMPGLGGTQTLARTAGSQRAREIIYTGRPFSAEEALDWGVAARLFDAGSLFAETLSCAKRITQNAPLSVKAVKAAMGEGRGLPLGKALEKELTHYNNLLNTDDRHEGINAFNEKRTPKFSGT